MGTYIHRAVIAGMPPWLDSEPYASRYREAEGKLAAFRESLPDDWRALVVGPVAAIVNGFQWVIFLPDGSKEWWDTSDEGDVYREQFMAIFPGALVAAWGDDEPTLSDGLS